MIFLLYGCDLFIVNHTLFYIYKKVILSYFEIKSNKSTTQKYKTKEKGSNLGSEGVKTAFLTPRVILPYPKLKTGLGASERHKKHIRKGWILTKQKTPILIINKTNKKKGNTLKLESEGTKN